MLLYINNTLLPVSMANEELFENNSFFHKKVESYRLIIRVNVVKTRFEANVIANN